MTELETGAWISAQGQHKSEKTLRRAPVGLRTKMWTCSSSRPSRKTEAIFFTECSFVLVSTSSTFRSVVILSTVRDTFQSSSALSFQYVYGSVESSHLEEFEI